MTEHKPKLSVIVPIYNVEAYLHRCIDSVLAQTFTDFELILVDDGSPDNCGAICDAYALKDPRVRVIHKENGGRSDARNTGLDACRGDYIGFVDADDYISSRMYQRLLELIERYGADMATTGFVNVDENGNHLEVYPQLSQECLLDQEDFIDHFYPDNKWKIFASPCNKLYRKRIFQNLRYPEGKPYEDSFLLLPLLDRCHEIAVDDEHHYFYFNTREGSIMNERYSPQRFLLIDLSLEQYAFFANKGLTGQQEYALSEVVSNYMINFFAVYIAHAELKKMFKPYRSIFQQYLWRIMRNHQICRMKKLVVLMMYLNKKAAYRFCRKYFPECLPADMRT
jgi:glycosyltransferase involved in cell wall biosynthesis